MGDFINKIASETSDFIVAYKMGGLIFFLILIGLLLNFIISISNRIQNQKTLKATQKLENVTGEILRHSYFNKTKLDAVEMENILLGIISEIKTVLKQQAILDDNQKQLLFKKFNNAFLDAISNGKSHLKSIAYLNSGASEEEKEISSRKHFLESMKTINDIYTFGNSIEFSKYFGQTIDFKNREFLSEYLDYINANGTEETKITANIIHENLFSLKS